ncbi:MAG TPA: hypothetical protein VJZ76_10835 [Thermoanaerobaculia bacterium]|nr:hypothetical protein [Thermoanaerobaculia bacterium]
MSWQALRDLYDDIETPIALTRFAREIIDDIIAEAPVSEDAKSDLCKEVRNALDTHLEGEAYVLANYLVVLLKKFPAADPYLHLNEE